MTTFAIAQHHLTILQFIDRHDFPQVFVQPMDLLHFLRCQLEFVDLQIIQQLGFDDALKLKIKHLFLYSRK